MFDELYPESADRALTTKVNRPPTPKPAAFSTWGMFKGGLGGGMAAGAAQGIASTGEMLGAFGTTLATTGGSAGGMFQLPTEAEQKQQLEAMDKLIKGDELFAGGEVTRSFRNVAEGYKPDPTTTHAAEQVVFNFARVGSKAITAALTMGNVPGAIVAGAEEGFTQAEELKQQGVDIGTRTKVGAVTAVTNAVGFALPVAGKTWLGTAGLVAVGGPGTFVTQQAATREILENANYTDLAKQYDPTDKLGLAMSVLLPGAFGALAMRGAAKSVKAKGAPAPDAASVPDTAPTPEAVPVPKAHPTEELVDAARVSLVRQYMDAANPLPDNVETAAAHNAAYSQALDQITAGERVSVDVSNAIAVKAAEEMAPRIEAAQAAAKAEADLMPKQAPALADTAQPAIKTVAPDSFNPATLATEAADMLKGGKPVAQVLSELEVSGAKVAPELRNMLIGVSEFGGRVNELAEQVSALRSQRGTGVKPFELVAQAVENMRTGSKVEAPKPKTPTEARFADLQARNPDVMDKPMQFDVDEDGNPTGATTTAREYLERIQREADQDTADASLIEVAANCFLGGA